MTESDKRTPVKSKLILVRHGETDNNAYALLTGQLEIPLNERGREQARAAGKALDDQKIDKVYSSNLTRAFETAVLALSASSQNQHLKDQVEQRSEIIEFDMGAYAGQVKSTGSDSNNWWKILKYEQPLPGGESMQDVFERVNHMFRREVLPRLQRGETVMIVAHSGILRVFDYVLGFELPLREGDTVPQKNKIPNAEPLIIDFENGQVKCAYYSGGSLQTPRLPKIGL